ncbi:MAG: hypothetical protein ACE5J3_12290 [Methanosarcinales archaeon]
MISLLEKNATKESRAVKLNRTEMLEKMIKLERVKETKDEKFYLTQMGYGIAFGAKEIYIA